MSRIQKRTQIGKIKNINKTSFVVKIAIMLGLLVLPAYAPAFAQAPQKTISQTNLAASIQSAGLPVGKVESFPVKDAKGTVVLIPQVHQGPGTKASDPANDSAQTAQGQIYKIVSYLTKDAKVPLVMAEGDMYGPVPPQKISQLKQKIDAKNQLVQLSEKLKTSFQQQSLNPKLEASLITGLQGVVQSTDREIILKGAPYKLSAEGATFTLYGAETPATYKAAADIVRDYIYLQDRMQQLSGSGRQNALYSSSSGPDLSSLLAKQRPAQNTVASDLSQLQQLAASSGNSSETSLLAETQKNLQQLAQTDVQPVSSNVPSRADNPYANVSDVRVLQSKLTAAEANIQRVVIDQRNSDTAANFARMLTDNHQTMGVLQFGAQHQEGLLKEFKKQGLSVIVATPQEVLSDVGGSVPVQRQPALSPSSSPAANAPSSLQQLAEQLKQRKLATPGQASPQGSIPSSNLDQQQLESLRSKLNSFRSQNLSR